MKIVAHFEVPFYQIIDEASQAVSDLPEFAKDPTQLIQLYRLMVLNRVFDSKAIALQRTGKLGTYPSTLGQEAAFVGVGSALEQEDVLVPYYRDVGILIQRSVKLSDILLYWGGDERGNCFANPLTFPYSVPVGSQPLHAAGVATAIKIRKQKKAVLTVCGDGASSQGDFYEAMNVAGVWKLPVVFVVINNQWAISVPRSQQTAAETIAQKAIAAGFAGEQVDGNDVIAVKERVSVALKKAREEHQPTLIEILCYRHCDHTTADDAKRYEVLEVRQKEWSKEPLVRLRQYLENQKLWSSTQEAELIVECEKEVAREVDVYLNMPAAKLETTFDYLYHTLPRMYEEQRETIKKWNHSHD